MDRNEADRNLHAAARESPELAAILAGRHDEPSPRYRRVAKLLAAGLLAIGVVWLASSALPRPKRAEPADEVDTSVYLAPIQTQPAGQGEEISPFAGFAVSVDTDPPGALVAIGGAVRGEAPVLANVSCRAAEKVEIRAQKAGFRPVRRELSCRADTLVKLTLRLEQ